MGHLGADIADEYREKISDERRYGPPPKLALREGQAAGHDQRKRPADTPANETPRLRLFTARMSASS